MNVKLKQALDNFVKAAEVLENEWSNELADSNSLTEGYPKYLPSFDEFLLDLHDWHNANK